ncbi:MAG: UbiD family decarboxylase [Thermoproteota archaeon]|nr:UbiD family decarboxylase [Thermoproteota archaeon]MDQ4101192.1 UbiD family decarboxylase [Thermoproteota archaeon]
MKSTSNDFRSFMTMLENEDELVRIKKEVKAEYEIAAVTAKLDRKQAVLFENVNGSKNRVACNVLGTAKRFYLALRGIPKKSEEYSIKREVHSSVIEALNTLSEPVRTEGGALFEENSSRNLHDLPIVTHFEKDAGPFITSSIVFSQNQENGKQNQSTHRLLRLDDRHMAIRMVEGRHLHKCFTYARDHGEDLKVAIAIGVHPAVNIAAAYQAAYGVDEMLIANSLLGGSLVLTKTSYSKLYVPSHAEFILEGRILNDKTHEEWMVEMLRTYDFRRKQPVFELERIMFRHNAIYHDILPGYAEHRLLMGLPVEAKMYEHIKNVVPTTRSVHLTDGGSNWLSAVIQIKKRLEGEPKNALLAAFSAHPSLKIAIVVDDDINPTDPVAVEYAITTRCQADRDLVIIPDAKGSSLDPSSDQHNLLTTKLGIDATATILKSKERFEIAKIPGEEKIHLSEYL